MLSAFLPLIMLAYGTTEFEGFLALAPWTATLVWLYGSVVAGSFLLSDRANALGQRLQLPSFALVTGVFTWSVVIWIIVWQASAAPGRWLAPSLSQHFPQTWPMLISTVLFAGFHWWGRNSLHRIFQSVLDPQQSATDFFRARMTLPILFFPPMLAWMFLEDTIIPTTAIPGLSNVHAFLLAPMFFLGLYLISPYLFNLAWQAKPLADEGLQQKIVELAKRTDTTLSGVKLWNTFHESVPNAAVAGLSDRYRYVYVTEFLLELFTPEQVLAAIAHEIGHLRLGHVWTYLLFSLDLVFFSLLAKLGIFAFFPAAHTWLEGLNSTLELVAFLVIFLLFFTALTRYSEHQADRFSAVLVGQDAFTGTMNMLQDFVSPPPSWVPTWALTHPTFTARTAAVQNFDGNPQTLIKQARRVRLALLMVGILILVLSWPAGLRVLAVNELHTAITHGTAAEAVLQWQRMPSDMRQHPVALQLLGETAFSRGKPAAALLTAATLHFSTPLPEMVILEILQHPTTPEIAFHFEIMQFLLQSLDLHGVHGVSLFDEALDHVQIALRQI